MFELGLSLKWLPNQYFRSTTYESNVLYALRFMIDCSVVGGNWVELPAGRYMLVQPQVRARRPIGGGAPGCVHECGCICMVPALAVGCSSLGLCTRGLAAVARSASGVLQ